jgi:hypothetical protein
MTTSPMHQFLAAMTASVTVDPFLRLGAERAAATEDRLRFLAPPKADD